MTDDEIIQTVLNVVRTEYTTLPRFGYHLALDYDLLTLPPKFDSPVQVDGEELLLPPASERHGGWVADQEYLQWGRRDYDDIFRFIQEEGGSLDRLRVMDFGCSSGRVLRHFYPQVATRGWKLIGVDVSARRIEWLRRYWPSNIEVYVGSFLPRLPYEDNSIDVIYGISVFTHIKYLWDMWLLEMRRVLKPGGLLIQSVHTERAWDFFAQHKDESWVKDALGTLVIDSSGLPEDYVYYGDLEKNQVFWKSEIVKDFWGRYFRDVTIKPPTPHNYQDWIVARK